MPLANTKACPVTDGTDSSGACAAAGFGFGAAPIIWVLSAANVKAAVPSTQARAITTARGKSVPSRMPIPSEPNGGVVIPLPGEQDDGTARRRRCCWLVGDDREDRAARRDRSLRVPSRRRILPAEGDVREALEPRQALRVDGLRIELEMEVRAARVAGHPDQADFLPRREPGSGHDARVERGEMAVRPGLSVGPQQREPESTARIGVRPGALVGRVGA